ncbi:MAG: pyridoxal-phosphate dependent enzyme [Gemmatimonadetes bacterium]|nr:pyridoxal-phosphate dependent enzyme [Gemmatimonadota bacterium]
MPASLPVAFADVAAARARLRPHLPPSPVRHYPQLDALAGHGVRVLVKHENHLPTGSFKVRNGTSALTALPPEAAARGVIAATTGNHGLGLAWAGARLGIAVTICVPEGNNPEKNAGIRALGATVVEAGARYDETVAACAALAEREGRTVVHSTNDRGVLAGAATLTAEFLEEAPALDALVLALGGGSQAVGAMVTAAAMRPGLRVYAVQSAGAPAQHDAWHDGVPRQGAPVRTFAEGIATGSTYALTFEALRAGLAGFVAVPDDAIAEGVRTLWQVTHNLAEGAGAAGWAGLRVLAPQLADATVGVVMCGGNLDAARAVTILGGGTPT